ncbi:MAG: hypothetical protein EZS28_009769 [Streblomastix strix]|uniref:Uncharacterized protein n=1 Tax=Streblomastix strix TaxID=222440 RepID=A0A5J4WJ11_9EUKA|nr:MAG: hypothetical protein EZS28_009769 [Streblomastix strix]
MLKPDPKRKAINISKLSAFEQLNEKRSRKLGESQGPRTSTDEAMKQLGQLIARQLHRDISKVDRFIHPQSALDWLREKKLDQKGQTIFSEDFDNNASAPNDIIVRNCQRKLYLVAGYRTIAPKKRLQTVLYEEQNPTSQDHNIISMKTWQYANVKPNRYVYTWNYYKKLVAQTLKSFGHRIQKIYEVEEDIRNNQKKTCTILQNVI